jgi:hypothetical protein
MEYQPVRVNLSAVSDVYQSMGTGKDHKLSNYTPSPIALSVFAVSHS